jgi:hypothetical protein
MIRLAVKPWQIGNTTVRNPYRLKDGLRVLALSPLIGNLEGRENESAFAELLHEAGVVAVQRIESGEAGDYSDVGRKWRSALDKMGFITPKLSRHTDERGIDPRLRLLEVDIPGLTGRPYELTPQGRRLINAATLVEEQECFLRAMVARQHEPTNPLLGQPFSSLRMVLKVMADLESRGAEPSINMEEMAAVVQFVTSEQEAEEAAEAIIDFRERRAGEENKRAFDNAFRRNYTQVTDETRLRTFGDYADTNRRYLRATGLFNLRGRSIILAERRRMLVNQLLQVPFVPADNREHFAALWNGAYLPTDREPEARQSIKILASTLRKRGEAVRIPNLGPLPIQELTQIRFKLEKQIEKIQEEDFAAQQRRDWQDILEYMTDLLRSRSRRERIPPSEDPAYLEWCIWRAFLAIDSLVNKPGEARRFQVDQDFLPVRTAPGNGPDMMFEFDDFVLVVEVTLSGGSRQEAMEGEPVRRHVARVIEDYERAGKEVYGLFIAIDIDTNTAETFRVGTWYKRDDSRLTLGIVPLRLDQFARIFEAGFSRGELSPNEVRRVLDNCLGVREAEAPVWKSLIAGQIDRACASFV